MKLNVLPGSILCALFACTLLSAHAAETSGLESVRSLYERLLAKIDDDYASDIELLNEQYHATLQKSMETFHKQGDLDGLLASTKEKERFQAEEKVPGDSPPELSLPLKGMQHAYRKALIDAEVKKYRKLVALQKQYASRLELLKKDLTKKGEFDEAMRVKKTIDSLPAIQPSESIAETVNPTMVGCPRCGGTGKMEISCAECHDPGRCRSCNGSGSRPAELVSGTIRCITCRGTGKCRKCDGKGTIEQECPRCKGKGKIPGTKQPDEPQPLPSPEPSPTRVADSPKAPTAGNAVYAFEEEMARYVATMHSLDQLYRADKIENVEFRKALATPAQYVGKVLKSEVLVVSAHPRGVRVAPDADSAREGGTMLAPFTLNVGTSAQKVFNEIGQNGLGVITYGVVSKDHITLFELRRN